MRESSEKHFVLQIFDWEQVIQNDLRRYAIFASGAFIYDLCA